jgi:hypothetical protein
MASHGKRAFEVEFKHCPHQLGAAVTAFEARHAIHHPDQEPGGASKRHLPVTSKVCRIWLSTLTAILVMACPPLHVGNIKVVASK